MEIIQLTKRISNLKYSELIKRYETSTLCREELTRRAKKLLKKPNRRQNIIIDNNK